MALGGGSALNIDGSLHCSKAPIRVEGHPSIQATGVALKGTINGKILSHLHTLIQHIHIRVGIGGITVLWMTSLWSCAMVTLNLRTMLSPSGPGSVTLTVIRFGSE